MLTYSSGNHAQAVALAGRLLGVPTTIVMPQDAPAVKLEALIRALTPNEVSQGEVTGSRPVEIGGNLGPPVLGLAPLGLALRLRPELVVAVALALGAVTHPCPTLCVYY